MMAHIQLCKSESHKNHLLWNIRKHCQNFLVSIFYILHNWEAKNVQPSKNQLRHFPTHSSLISQKLVLRKVRELIHRKSCLPIGALNLEEYNLATDQF